jgi:acetyl-CoA carboxylase beta subunit
MIKKLFKRLFCKHINTKTITNIYGDAINHFNARSIRECTDCGKTIYHPSLDKNCKVSNKF